MQTYQSTPDYYRDYIEHGYLKDQAAKVHKYIERWRGKNGKWYYRYKSKAQEAITKYNRSKDQITSDPETITTNYGKKELVAFGRRNWSGKQNALLDGQTGSRVVKTTKVSSKVSRKPKKKGNLTSRGYSDSKSSSNNKATEKKIARREHMDYLKSNSVRNTVYGWEKNPNGSIIDKETGKRYSPYRKRRKTNKYK